MNKIDLRQGDCLELMKDLPDKSIDLILCDLPYGTTACKWDNIIPFEPLWEQYNRIIKDKGAIVLFGSEPFSSKLRLSNLKNYKYDWIWYKRKAGNIFLAKFQPMKVHENISVFSNNTHLFYPIKTKRDKVKTSRQYSTSKNFTSKLLDKTISYSDRNPISILDFSNASQVNRLHSTQKPVPLLEYLIKTYTL
ncbi:MAG: DNA methyltransferase, partial [Bacilli bacterium]